MKYKSTIYARTNPLPEKTLTPIITMRHTLILLFAALICATAAAKSDATIEILSQKADSMHAAGDNDGAISTAREALEAAEGKGDSTAIMAMHSSMGVYLRTAGRVNDALEHYGKAMKICTTKNFHRTADEEARQTAAMLYLNLATLHVDMKHKKEAAHYARQAAAWSRLCKDKAAKAQLLAQDGLVLMMCGDNAGATEMLEESYGLSTQLGQYPSALSSAAYMVAVADRSADHEAEALWRARCRGLEDKVDDTMTLMAYHQILCAIDMNHKRWREAIAQMDEILSLKGVEKMPFVVYDCYNNIHDAWAGLGQWHKAYDALRKATALKDSLFEADKAENLRELDAKYRAKEKELDLAESKATLAETRMWLAVGALAMLLFAVGVTFYVQAQHRKTREREAEFARLKADTDRRLTRRYIDGLESERERLAKELHDGVCNDLYTVEMILQPHPSLPRREGREGTLSAKEFIARCREQVRRVSHELMPPEFSYADVSLVLDDYLERTAEASGTDISFNATPAGADWTAVSDDTALVLYRITQEAVANAVKHSGATHIEVTLGMTQTALTLTVTDNGTPAERTGTGIGRRTMRQRAEAAGGRLTTERKDGKTILQFTLLIHNSQFIVRDCRPA